MLFAAGRQHQEQRLVFGSHDKHLYCLDARTGSLLYRVTLEGLGYSSPCIAINSRTLSLATSAPPRSSLRTGTDGADDDDDDGSSSSSIGNTAIIIGCACDSESFVHLIDFSTGAVLFKGSIQSIMSSLSSSTASEEQQQQGKNKTAAAAAGSSSRANDIR
eukprot:GEZU01022631.1.p1 GENE.GEZU01022631.1~~GEZU01022631.1.p1  ORF type:complete len:161 (+),score=34.36 GEZU01022631.1:308-790(+)